MSGKRAAAQTSLFYNQLLAEPEKGFRKLLVCSFAGHIGLVVLVALLQLSWGVRPELMNSLEADLVLASDVRLGRGGTPVATPKAVVVAPAPLAANEPVAMPAPKEKTPPPPAAKSEDRRPLESTKEVAPVVSKAEQRRLAMRDAVAGLQGESDKGGATVGRKQAGVDPASLSDDLLEAVYRKQVKQRIVSNLHITNRSEWYGRYRNRVVRYRVKLNAAGEVTAKELEKSSGVSEMDTTILAAIMEAAPFPPPSDALRKKLESEGLLVDYSPSYDEGAW